MGAPQRERLQTPLSIEPERQRSLRCRVRSFFCSLICLLISKECLYLDEMARQPNVSEENVSRRQNPCGSSSERGRISTLDDVALVDKSTTLRRSMSLSSCGVNYDKVPVTYTQNGT